MAAAKMTERLAAQAGWRPSAPRAPIPPAILVAQALVFSVAAVLAQPTINSVYPPTLTDRAGDHVAYVVSATASSGSLTYAWYQTGSSTMLSTSNSLVLVNIQPPNGGTYYAVVTDSKGSTTSGNVTLNVLAAGVLALYPSNLVVARVGDGIQALSGRTGNTLYLDQYTPGGSYVNSIQIPDEGTGQPYGTGSSSSTALPFGSPALLIAGGNVSPGNDAGYEAFLSRAPNGQNVSFGGYCQAYPFSGPDVSAEPGGNGGNNWRGIGAVDAYGNYTLVWTNTGLYSAGNHQVHGAADLNGSGTSFYTTGEAGSGNGIKYCSTRFEPANGSGVASVAGSFAGTRVAQIISGNLVFSDGGAATNGIYACIGLPATTANAVLLVAETNSPMDFAASPDLQTVYVADNGIFGGTSKPAGGIQRWDASGTGPAGFPAYHYSYTLGTGTGSTAGARGLTVDFSAASTWGSGVTGAKLYVTTAEASANRLLRMVDTGAVSSATLLAAAVSNQMLGGVRFSPVVAPPSFAVQPQSQTASAGSPVTFSALAVGTGPLIYQWYFEPSGAGPFSPITNATNASYTISAAGSNNVGNYYVVVTNITLSNAQSQTVSFSLPGVSPVTLSVNTQSPGAAIPSDFLGLSFETGNLQSNGVGVAGYMFDSANTQLVTLFTNRGIKNLRVGGTSVDRVNGIIPQYTPTNQDIDALFRFANAAGVKVVFSLRLENGNPAQDAAIAGYTGTNYAQYLTCLAIGNEPDSYSGGDHAITNFSSFLAKWTSFAATITSAVPAAKFGGPDSGDTWAGDFANAEIGSSGVTWIFSHFYFGGDSSGLTPQQIISGMLSPSWDTSTYPSHYSATQAIANANGFPYRATEFNSYVAPYPGIWGGNNSFASALFACDAAHWWAAHGCNGVNFHTFLGKYNATVYYDAGGNYQIFPIGYGQKAFDVGGHGSVMPVALANTNGLNLAAYAVGDNTNLYVTIINKEYGAGARDTTASILAQGFVTGSVQAMFLAAPAGVGATNGVTLGGAFITNNAPWLGQWTTLSPLTNGQCALTVPNSSAAIVKIQATALFAPPVVVTDLPAQVRLAAARSYPYSVAVTGGLPLSYQWYQNASPVAGATNASYLATAGAAGSMATYSVVITNNSGAATSMVSTLTVVSIPPPLTDYYARQVLSYGPVGYWPLQETNAPAPGNWETNYGTLGKLGNAYYACTNASGVAFAQPGALAGTVDPCVVLSGGSANPNSYAFVPRLTPALTIQAPFTLEAWVNMANNGYGVEIGEGSGTGLDGGANFGGFQMGQGLQTAGNQFQMNYFTGAGNSQNEEQETSLLYTAGQSYHYVVTYDGANSILYVNGQAIFTGTSANAPDTWSPLGIGACKWDYGPIGGGRWFNGSLDGVAIYTNVLSALQINNHYLAGISPGSNYFQTVLSARPLLYYRMDCPGYLSPWPALYPSAVNFGSSPVSGAYPPGIVPGGLAGPPIAALGTNSVAAPINGVVSCVDAGYDPAFNPTGTQPFTAMSWFRTYPADGRTQAIMSHGGASSWAINLVGTSGVVIWNSGAGLVVSTNILNDGTWHFVAGVYDGTRNYLYVDGALNYSGTATHGVVGNTTDDVLLGGDPDYTLVGDNEQYLAGAVAQAAFFTNALTSGQVQAIYQAGIRPPPPATLAIQNLGAGQLQLNWNYGALQTATNVAGPYRDVAAATSPSRITPTNVQEFYRVRVNQ